MKITENEKTSFVSAIICGLISYGYFLTHHFLTYDSMWNLYSDQNMISSGRQFLMFACKISSDYDLPWLNGLLAILYLALASIMLVKLLKVEGRVTAILIAGFTVMFPSVTSTFAYSFTVDGYMLAVLLSVVAVYITEHYKYGFVAAIFVLGFSIGIYQAYFSYAIILCIVVLLLKMLDGEEFKKLLCLAGKFAVMGIFAYVFYVVSLKIMLKLEGEALSGYQGTESVTSFSLKGIPTGLKTAFWSFIDFARWGNVLTTTVPMKLAFILLAISSAVLFVYLFIKKSIYKNVGILVFTLLLLCLIPFGATTVAIISPDTYVHLLIRMPWALLFVFAVTLGEKVSVCENAFGKCLLCTKKTAYVFAFVMLLEFAVVANIAGFNMNERYEKTYATCVRIADRLEQMEGYKTGMPVAILGGYPNKENYPSTDITKNVLNGYFGVDGELCVNSTAKYAEFMSHYLNVTVTTADAATEEAIAASEEFKEMENFPSSESIRKIDGVWVIRING